MKIKVNKHDKGVCGFCGTPKKLINGKRRDLYNWYINHSESWQSKRLWAVERAGGWCQMCGVMLTHFDVHHLTYEHMGYEYPSEIIAICRDCHKKIHSNQP